MASLGFKGRSLRRSLVVVGAFSLLLAGCESEVDEGGGGGATATTTTSSQGAAGAGGAATGTTTGGGSTAVGGGGAGGGGVAGGGGSGAIECNPSTVSCDGPVPQCTPGEVPSVNGSCWGPCVPILSCATEANCDNCQGGFCAQYQAWTTEYRCVAPSLQCSALSCGCLAPYFCVDPFDSCQEVSSGDHVVTCSCPTC